MGPQAADDGDDASRSYGVGVTSKMSELASDVKRMSS